MNAMLKDIWQSNEDFHNRFLGRAATVEEALTAYREEVKELDEAALGKLRIDVVFEAADVLYTIIGLLRSRDIPLHVFEHAIQAVIEKNDAKTHETHYIREDGKIARRK